jgi:stage V sporulation protein AC
MAKTMDKKRRAERSAPPRIRTSLEQSVDDKNREEARKKEYQQMTKEMAPKRPVVKNGVKAFLIGGLICTFGQWIQNIYIDFFNYSAQDAGNPTTATLIFISTILTGFGIWDRFGQFAGAGAGVPVTGFANSMASAAIEHRSEGFVLGVGGNMFKLAGSVVVFGVVSAFIIGLVRTLLTA